MKLTVEAEEVWLKGKIYANYNSSEWRVDDFNNLMFHDSYGQTNTQYGWEIDHIKQVQHGGSDNIENKRPLQWEQNRER